MTAASRADATRASTVEVVVKPAASECFVSLVNASGYLLPRATAVVMFNAPGFRLSEVYASVGKHVERGEIVARAIATAPPKPSSDEAPADVPIKSLASGLVLKSTAFVGKPTSQSSEPLLTLAVDDEIEAAVAVPSFHVEEVQAGQGAHIEMPDATIISGHVRSVAPTIDPSSQMGEARVSFAAGPSSMVGRFVRATIEARRSCGLGVPRAALRRTAAGVELQVVAEDIVQTRIVRVGLANGADVQIASGLSAGELVVTSTGAELREGDRVKPITPELQDAD